MPEPGRIGGITKINQFFLTLIKLRHNIPFYILAMQVSCGTTTVSVIMWKWVDLMYVKLSFLVRWPDRETMKECNPLAFKSLFPRLTGIMDCFEISIDRPKNVKTRAQVYSNYKHHSTVKVFIVCRPLGAVTYVSPAWGGRVSDIQLVKKCGFISSAFHQPGDQLLADRGFTLVADFAAVCGAKLLIPSFTKGKKQLSPKEVETSRMLASVRMHIERVIGLMKNRFSILQGPMPISLVKTLTDEAEGGEITSIDKVIKVCAALTNLGDGIVYNE